MQVGRCAFLNKLHRIRRNQFMTRCNNGMQHLKRALGVLGLFLLTIAAVGCSADAKKSRALTRANDYFASGDYDKAKIEYLSVLKTGSQQRRRGGAIRHHLV